MHIWFKYLCTPTIQITLWCHVLLTCYPLLKFNILKTFIKKKISGHYISYVTSSYTQCNMFMLPPTCLVYLYLWYRFLQFHPCHPCNKLTTISDPRRDNTHTWVYYCSPFSHYKTQPAVLVYLLREPGQMEGYTVCIDQSFHPEMS